MISRSKQPKRPAMRGASKRPIEETAAKLIGAQLAIARGTKKRELIPDELLHVRFELLAGLTKRETTMLLASLMALTEFIS